MQNWKQYLAELLGTFLLVFVGAGTIVAYETFSTPNLLGVALAHGLALMVIVYTFAHISGAHVNPAVTLAMLATQKMKLKDGVLYIVSQLIGSVIAASALKLMFLDLLATQYGTPALAGGVSVTSGIIAEAIMTFILVWVIFSVVVDQGNNRSNIAGVAIGGTLTANVLVGAVLTGAALNPARWFGPALISNVWDSWYVYLIGPVVGGLLAGLLYQMLLLKRK